MVFRLTIILNHVIHRKKGFSIFPSPAGMSLTKLSLGMNNLYMTSLFPPRESLVSDILAGDGNIEKLFLRCIRHACTFLSSERSRYASLYDLLDISQLSLLVPRGRIPKPIFFQVTQTKQEIYQFARPLYCSFLSHRPTRIWFPGLGDSTNSWASWPLSLGSKLSSFLYR
jgi:hypothetical protein